MALMKRCAVCGKIMMVRPSLRDRKKTCSKICQNIDKIGKRVSPATEFKPGHRPQTLVPVGTESMSKGYMRVKVAEPNVWRQRSHIVWEKANGRALPAGWIIRHLDNDPVNDNPENLVAMSRGGSLSKTLDDPAVAAKRDRKASRAAKSRWNAYREKKLEKYDTYYWQEEAVNV